MAKPLAFYAKNTIEGVSATRLLSPFLGKNELAALSYIKRFRIIITPFNHQTTTKS